MKKILTLLLALMMVFASSITSKTVKAETATVSFATQEEGVRSEKGESWVDSATVDVSQGWQLKLPPASNVVSPKDGYVFNYAYVHITNGTESYNDYPSTSGEAMYNTEKISWWNTATEITVNYRWVAATLKYTYQESSDGAPEGFVWENEKPNDQRPTVGETVVLADPLTTAVTTNADGVKGTWTWTWDTNALIDGKMPEGTVEIPGTWTFTPTKSTINVTKVWKGDEEDTSERPESITIALMKGEAEIGTLTLSDANNWAGTFNDVTGEASEFTVKETGLNDAYELEAITEGVNKNTTNTTFTVTNKKKPVEITIKKTWDDDKNPLRPKEITITIKKDGVKVKQLVLKGNGDEWVGDTTVTTGKFENITIEENTINGYKYTIDRQADQENERKGTFLITNTLNNTTNVSIVKKWDDNNNQDGIRPENVSITLYANDEEYGTYGLSGDGDEWSTSITKLPVYNGNGEEVTYTAKEKAENVPKGYTSNASNTTVTNKHIPENVTVTVTKEWDDDDNRDGKRPENVTFTILANNEDSGEKLVVNEGNSWNTSNTTLPKYKDGVEVKYSLEEEKIEDYSSESNPPIVNTTSTSYTYKNTHKPETISVSVTKVWEDEEDQDGIRPDSITVNLLGDGETVHTFELNESNNWSDSKDDLYKYKAGEEITYTIEEDEVSGYSVNITEESESSDVTTIKYTLTNTHEPDTIDIEVEKKWVGDNASDRPATITVILKGDDGTTKTAKLTKDTNWKYTFKDLPKYKDGKEIKYTVEEVKVEGYTTKVDGYLITNTIIPKPNKPKYYIPQTGVE